MGTMLRPLQPPLWAQRDAHTPPPATCSSQGTPKPHPQAVHEAEPQAGGGEGRTPPPLRQGHPRPPPPPEPCPARPGPARPRSPPTASPGPRGPAPPSPGRLYRARGGGGRWGVLRFEVWICFRSNRAVVTSQYLHAILNPIVLLQRGPPWRGGGKYIDIFQETRDSSFRSNQ